MVMHEVIEFPVDPNTEGLEAECRRLMHSIATYKVRGFDTAKERQRMIAILDEALDLYNVAQGA